LGISTAPLGSIVIALFLLTPSLNVPGRPSPIYPVLAYFFPMII
jgi:hypothetical protein